MQASRHLICRRRTWCRWRRAACSHDHAVAIDDGRIVARACRRQTRSRADSMRAQSVRLERHALIPGLVNLHCHAAMTLMRGIADDMPLMTWLQEHIWPAEAKHVSDEFVHDGSLLAHGGDAARAA